MRTIIPATADTIVAFHIGRGGSFNDGGYLTFLGEAKIKDFTGGLFSPLTEGEGEDEDELIDDLSPDAEWTDESGNGVGLTNAMVESGIGRIEEDGIYDTTYTMRLGDVEFFSKEWKTIFREPADICYDLNAARSFLTTKYFCKDGIDAEVKLGVLREALDCDKDYNDLMDSIAHNYITVNKGRNGDTYVWYLDGEFESCYNATGDYFADNEEIKQQLL